MATALGCEHCEFGMVSLAESSIERISVRPDRLDDGSLSPEDQARAEMEHRCAVAAARNSVYPCRHCNTDRFYRWAKGHFESSHDRGSCEECVDAGLAPGRRRVSGGTIKRGSPEAAAMMGEPF